MSQIVICAGSVMVAVAVYQFLNVLTIAMLVKFCGDDWKQFMLNLVFSAIIVLMTFNYMLGNLAGVCK